MRKTRPHCTKVEFLSDANKEIVVTFYEPGVYYLLLQGFVCDVVTLGTDYYLNVHFIVPPEVVIDDGEAHPEYAIGTYDPTSRIYKIVCTEESQYVVVKSTWKFGCVLASVLHNNTTEPVITTRTATSG